MLCGRGDNNWKYQVGFQLKCRFCWEKPNWLNHLWGVFCFGKSPRMRGIFWLKTLQVPSTWGEYPKSYLHVYWQKMLQFLLFFFGKKYVSCRINLPEGAIFGASSLHDWCNLGAFLFMRRVFLIKTPPLKAMVVKPKTFTFPTGFR